MSNKYGRRNVRIEVYCTEAQKEAIGEIAKRHDVSLSSWLKLLLVKSINEHIGLLSDDVKERL